MSSDRFDPVRSSVLFVAIAFGLAGAYWLLYFVAGRSTLSLEGLDGALGALRGYGPALAALLAAWILSGRSGLVEIGSRVGRWRLPLRLYGAALLIPLLALTAVLSIAATVRPDVLHATAVNPLRFLLLFFVFAIVDGPLGEEIGWRGFLLPRLLETTGPLRASLVVGTVWYLWHLPLFAADGSRVLDGPFLVQYLALNLAYAVLHTWLFLRSGGSALLAVVFHTAGNYFYFLAVSLFPGLRSLELLRTWYVLSLGILALAAALSFRARSSRRDPARPGGSIPQAGPGS